MVHCARAIYRRGQLARWNVDRIVAAIIHELPEMTLLEARRFAHGWSRPQVIHGITALYIADGLATPLLNSSMLCRWEHGDRLPSAEYRDSLCRLYQVELSQLGLETHAFHSPALADRYLHDRRQMATSAKINVSQWSEKVRHPAAYSDDDTAALTAICEFIQLILSKRDKMINSTE
jgi:hypothetical protein